MPLQKTNDVEAIAREMNMLDTDLAAATTEIERLQRERQSVLLNGSDDDLRAHDEALGIAQRSCERAAARKQDAERRLEEATTVAAATERSARRDAADAAAKEGATLIRKALTALNKVLAGLPERATLIGNEIERVNRSLQEGEEPLPGLEARLFEGRFLPRKVLSEKTVELWVYESTGHVISDQTNVRTQGAGRGSIFSQSYQGSTRHDVILKKFRRREILPEVRSNRTSLIEALDTIRDLISLDVEDTREPEVELLPLIEPSASQTTDGAHVNDEDREQVA